MSTETRDPRFVEIDQWPTRLAVEAMLEGQLAAVASLKDQLDRIAAASDAAALRLSEGGRLAYAGAGTSGRIAVQDGVELSPTYDWPAERLVFILAGGLAALAESVEGAEDDEEDAGRQVAEAAIGRGDVIVGVAASGRTKFTVAAVHEARRRGALAIAVANNPDTPLLRAADHVILADTGSELIAGSTRMKAGTAQKAALNMLSTAMMLRCGLVYRGLMVNMRVSNEKLAVRARSIVAELTGASEAAADNALARSEGEIKKAVLLATGIEPARADALLDACKHNLRKALDLHRTGWGPRDDAGPLPRHRCRGYALPRPPRRPARGDGGVRRSGRANTRIGVDRLYRRLIEVTDQALAQARLPPNSYPRLAAGFGIAGVSRPGARDKLSTLPFRFGSVKIASDAASPISARMAAATARS